ncbi:hypothetical protein CTI14_62790, partial [Methylobacterium radiotolerans]
PASGTCAPACAPTRSATTARACTRTTSTGTAACGQEVTWLLDRFAFYIAPRLSPDGTEAFLTGERHVRSSLRPYPFSDDREGLYPHDIDGDGRM